VTQSNYRQIVKKNIQASYFLTAAIVVQVVRAFGGMTHYDADVITSLIKRSREHGILARWVQLPLEWTCLYSPWLSFIPVEPLQVH